MRGLRAHDRCDGVFVRPDPPQSERKARRVTPRGGRDTCLPEVRLGAAGGILWHFTCEVLGTQSKHVGPTTTTNHHYHHHHHHHYYYYYHYYNYSSSYYCRS